MLQCVPAPLPDEAVRGYAQRIWARSGSDNPDCRRLLSTLSEVTGVSESHLLRQHSHLGYMRMVSPVHAGLDLSCHADRWTNPVVLQMRLPSERARFCRSCVSEDIGFHGIAYWRRVHQLPGVDVCTKHGLVLFEVPADTILRKSPTLDTIASPALTDAAHGVYKSSYLVQRFVALSDMAMQSTVPIAAAAMARVLSERRRQLEGGSARVAISTMVRDIAPAGWLAMHFPSLQAKDEGDRVASIDDVLRSRHVAYATKSYLLIMALLWDSPEDAMHACQIGGQEFGGELGPAAGERAIAAVMGGMSIRAACKDAGISLRDFEHALRRSSGKLAIEKM